MNEKTSKGFIIEGRLDKINEFHLMITSAIIEEANKVNTSYTNKAIISDIEAFKIKDLTIVNLKSYEFYGQGLKSINNNPTEALGYFRQSIKESPDFLEALEKAGFVAGVKLNLFDEAKEIFKKHEDRLYFKREASSRYAQNLYFNMGMVNHRMGDLTTSLDCFIKFKKIREFFNITSIRTAEAYIYLGSTYLDTGEVLKSSDFFINAKRMYEKSEMTDSLFYANSLTNLGAYYIIAGRDSALEYLERGKEVYETNEFTEKSGYLANLNNLGNLYMNKEEYDLAVKNYSAAVEKYKSIPATDYKGYANTLNNLGITYLRKGELEKSIENFEAAKKIFEDVSLTETWNYMITLKNLGFAYSYKNGSKSLENLILAEKLIVASKLQNNVEYADTCSKLGDIYNLQNLTDKANEHYKKAYNVYIKLRKETEARKMLTLLKS